MTAIVGIRMIGFKGFRRIFVGGRLRKACFVVIERHELHATKGWRRIGRVRKAIAEDIWDKLPAFEQTFQRKTPKPERAFYEFATPEAREKALMRHAWYRKKKLFDAIRAKLGQAA